MSIDTDTFTILWGWSTGTRGTFLLYPFPKTSILQSVSSERSLQSGCWLHLCSIVTHWPLSQVKCPVVLQPVNFRCPVNSSPLILQPVSPMIDHFCLPSKHVLWLAWKARHIRSCQGQLPIIVVYVILNCRSPLDKKCQPSKVRKVIYWLVVFVNSRISTQSPQSHVVWTLPFTQAGVLQFTRLIIPCPIQWSCTVLTWPPIRLSCEPWSCEVQNLIVVKIPPLSLILLVMNQHPKPPYILITEKGTHPFPLQKRSHGWDPTTFSKIITKVQAGFPLK